MTNGPSNSLTGTAFAFQSDQPHRITIEPAMEPGRWHRVLNTLWDEGVMTSLSDRAYRTFGAFLRLRSDDGTAFAPSDTLRRMTGHADRTLRYSRAELTGHPRRLLADLGSDRYAVLPGWNFAGRQPGTFLPDRGKMVPQIGTGVPRICAPSSERARAPYQTKESEIKTKTESGAQGAAPSGLIHPRGFGMGWPEWTLFGHRAIAAGDVRGVLADMKLGGPLLDATAALPSLSVAEIVSVASDVGNDREIVNPLRRPVAVAWRLHKARGMAMPQANKGGKGKGVGAILGAPVRSAESVRVSVDALSVAAGLDAIRKRRNLGG